MPSEQKQLLFDEKQTTLQKDYNVKNEIIDTIRSILSKKENKNGLQLEIDSVPGEINEKQW